MRLPAKATASLLLALTALAARPQQSPWSGSFERDAARSASMEEILELGMARLPRAFRVWPLRGEARRRLRDTNRPFTRIEFLPAGDSLTTVTEFYRLTTPLNGTRPRWERAEGDFVDVTTRAEGLRLEETFDAKDGRRVNVFTLSADGTTLTLDVTVTSPKLSSPLSYRQVFRRT